MAEQLTLRANPHLPIAWSRARSGPCKTFDFAGDDIFSNAFSPP